jgi:bacterial/archaeal transporter family protein
MENTEAQVRRPSGSAVDGPDSTGRGRFGVPAWLIFSLLTVLFYGLWGTLSKVVSNEMTPWTYQVVFSVGLLPVVAVLLRSRRLKEGGTAGSSRRRGMLYAFGTGILGGAGNIALYKSLGMGGEASIAVPVSSVYSVVTVILAFLFLKERVSNSQKLGLVIGFVAIYLLSL